MANSYSVNISFRNKDEKNSFNVLNFRSGLNLEQAVQLANSLWLSTDNDSIMVSVREKDSSVAQVVFHKRGDD